MGLQEVFAFPSLCGASAGVLCVAGLSLSLSPSYLHEGPDLSLAPCMVRDETLGPRGGGQVLLQSSEWNQITGPSVTSSGRRWREGGREGGGWEGDRERRGERGEGRGHWARKRESQPLKGAASARQQPGSLHAGGGARRIEGDTAPGGGRWGHRVAFDLRLFTDPP